MRGLLESPVNKLLFVFPYCFVPFPTSHAMSLFGFPFAHRGTVSISTAAVQGVTARKGRLLGAKPLIMAGGTRYLAKREARTTGTTAANPRRIPLARVHPDIAVKEGQIAERRSIRARSNAWSALSGDDGHEAAKKRSWSTSEWSAPAPKALVWRHLSLT
jgi:hypothetical protein